MNVRCLLPILIAVMMGTVRADDVSFSFSYTEESVADPTPIYAPAPGEVDMNVCYTALAPHGAWMEMNDYGWVWRPAEAVCNPTWRPYENSGRWIWTQSGWYWHSSYRWGAIPFHYGRWLDAPKCGWVWVPHFEWAPAWVQWHRSPNRYHWTPLPPRYRPVENVPCPPPPAVTIRPAPVVYASRNNMTAGGRLSRVMNATPQTGGRIQRITGQSAGGSRVTRIQSAPRTAQAAPPARSGSSPNAQVRKSPGRSPAPSSGDDSRLSRIRDKYASRRGR